MRPPSSTSAAALRVWSIIWSSMGSRTSPCLICQARRWRPPSGGWRARADRVHWIVADATAWEPVKAYDIWHDRAAFHFLTDENDRAAYIARLARGVKAGGHAIIATFALDGPETCSGLPVARYDSASLAQALGSDSGSSTPGGTNTQPRGARGRCSSSACFDARRDFRSSREPAGPPRIESGGVRRSKTPYCAMPRATS